MLFFSTILHNYIWLMLLFIVCLKYKWIFLYSVLLVNAVFYFLLHVHVLFVCLFVFYVCCKFLFLIKEPDRVLGMFQLREHTYCSIQCMICSIPSAVSSHYQMVTLTMNSIHRSTFMVCLWDSFFIIGLLEEVLVNFYSITHVINPLG